MFMCSVLLDMDSKTSMLEFYLNGKKTKCSDVNPRWTLLWYIREKELLTGSKLSCGSGGCGACTVMISEVDRQTKKIKHVAVNACIYPLVCVHGKAVTTVEGLGSTRTSLHPIQERLAKCHGIQCGFCSPGMVMSMYALLRNSMNPSFGDIEDAIQGNLCRCTGYRRILEGFQTFSDVCPMGKQCCQNSAKAQRDTEQSCKPQMLLHDPSEFRPLDASQDLIFPNDLQLTTKHDENLVFQTNENITWYRPSTVAEAIRLMSTVPNCRWAMGHLQTGLLKGRKENLISVGHLLELRELKIDKNHLVIGAATTLSELEGFLEEANKDREGNLLAKCFAVTFRSWKSGRQIKNVGTIGGNVMVRPKTGTFVPLLMTSRAEAVFYTDNGQTEITVPIDNSFLNDLPKRNSHDLLQSIKIPLDSCKEKFIGMYYANQQAHLGGRSAIVHAIFSASVSDERVLSEFKFTFAGIGDFPTIHSDVLNNTRKLDSKLPEEFEKWFNTQFDEDYYKKTTVINFFRKFTDDMQCALEKGDTCGLVTEALKPNLPLGTNIWEPPTYRKSVGHPFPTQWALEQATGEAKYIMDMPHYQDELYMALVSSDKAHANLVSIDATSALAIPGVVDFVSRKDTPGSNIIGFCDDEQVFASDKVTCVGQTIGAILAKSEDAAISGAKAVQIVYEELPPILTIHEALEKGSFLGPDVRFDVGDVKKGFEDSCHILEGEVEIGGQEHYYMETQCCIVVPKQEYMQYDVYSSTHNPADVQKCISTALGVPDNRINVHVRRLGGAFGGKEHKACTVAVPASVAAYKHNKPIRIQLERKEDMIKTGGRHPALMKYKIGFTKEGTIVCLDCEISMNGGNSLDVTYGVLENGCLDFNSVYRIPNLKLVGRQCKTNVASNTALRGFGVPQTTLMMHTAVEHIASYLQKDAKEIREINFFEDGYKTHYQQIIENCNIQKCWDVLIDSCEYEKIKEEIDKFNRTNFYVKRGVAIVPTKMNLGFDLPRLVRGNALINIYTDGSVLLHYGGVEMGQGLNIKMIQIASETLGIDYKKIIVSENSSYAVPNPPPTAASTSADLFGAAVKNGCDILNERLAPIKEKNPGVSWEDLVKAAYSERVNLSATGFYKDSNITWDEKKKVGNLFAYCSYGAACAVTELNVLTGEHKLLRTDIVFDIGKSLNPAIDIGQIEGGFLQGYGLFCLEEIRYDEKGKMISTGPSNYRVPTVQDIPEFFNVTLLKDNPNEKAVYSSKGIGEPPLLLGVTPYFALKNAITAARRDKGIEGYFQLNCPATPRKVLQAING